MDRERLGDILAKGGIILVCVLSVLNILYFLGVFG